MKKITVSKNVTRLASIKLVGMNITNSSDMRDLIPTINELLKELNVPADCVPSGMLIALVSRNPSPSNSFKLGYSVTRQELFIDEIEFLTTER